MNAHTPGPIPAHCKVIEWTPGKWWLVEVTGVDGSYTPIGEWPRIVWAVNNAPALLAALEALLRETPPPGAFDTLRADAIAKACAAILQATKGA